MSAKTLQKESPTRPPGTPSGTVALIMNNEADQKTAMSSLRAHSRFRMEVKDESALFHANKGAGERLNAYDVLVINNGNYHEPTPEGKVTYGIRMAKRFRDEGFTGQILLLKQGNAMSDAYEGEQLEAARKRHIAHFVEGGMLHWVPKDFVAQVDALVEAQRGKTELKSEGVHGHVGIVAKGAKSRAELNTVLEKERRKHREYQLTDIPDGVGGADKQDVVVVHVSTEAEAKDLEPKLRALRNGGFQGKILLIAEESDVFNEEVHPTTAIGIKLQKEGVVDDVLETSSVLHSVDSIGDRVARLAWARYLEKQRAEGLGEWGLEQRLEKLERTEAKWPESLQLQGHEIRAIGEGVRAYALQKQVVGGGAAPKFTYAAFAKEMDAQWDKGLREALEHKVDGKGKSRWDAGKHMPRDITEAEQARA
ncbi:MAG: hypothetical protein K2Q01_03360, partial [Rickettsiales bacterium]|nr:hypothetical protein [Rickettsiales bacterium]